MKNTMYDLVIGTVPVARDVSIPQSSEQTTRGVQTQCEAMNLPAALWKNERYLQEQGMVPSLANNAWTGAVAESSSSTSVASDLRLKFYYDRDMLMNLKSSRLSHVRLACLSSEHETSVGVWDPDRWFASVSSNTSDSTSEENANSPLMWTPIQACVNDRHC